VQYEYDALNRLTRVIYENGDSITYAYDTAGNIINVVVEKL
jgi:YD repeat-containing protein